LRNAKRREAVASKQQRYEGQKEFRKNFRQDLQDQPDEEATSTNLPE
jgi:hypothetical protein